MPADKRIRAITAGAAERAAHPAKLSASVERTTSGKMSRRKTASGRATETGYMATRGARAAVTLGKAAVTLGKAAVMRATHASAAHASGA
ncbi:MAG TPA: hypothetical protein VF306_17795 [Pirellulales bacterium]